MIGMKPKTRVNQGLRTEQNQSKFSQNSLTDLFSQTLNQAAITNPNIYHDPGRIVVTQ